MSSDPKRIKVAGVGSVLLGDDGIGPYVVRVLKALYDFGEGVEVEDLGTPGLDLIAHLTGIDALILIDAAKNDEPPGTITRYHREDITRHGPAVRLDPHSPALTESLMIADMAGGGPADLLLLGITGEQYEVDAGVSQTLRDAVPKIIREILRELDRLHAPYCEKTRPEVPDIWWNRDPATLAK